MHLDESCAWVGGGWLVNKYNVERLFAQSFEYLLMELEVDIGQLKLNVHELEELTEPEVDTGELKLNEHEERPMAKRIKWPAFC